MIAPSYFKASICHLQLMWFLHFLLTVQDFNYEEFVMKFLSFFCIIVIIDLLRFGQEGSYEFTVFYFLECLSWQLHIYSWLSIFQKLLAYIVRNWVSIFDLIQSWKRRVPCKAWCVNMNIHMGYIIWIPPILVQTPYWWSRQNLCPRTRFYHESKTCVLERKGT